MAYSVRMFDSIRDAPADDWNAVHLAVGDPFTDPRFVRLVEETLSSHTRSCVAVYYDHEQRPVAVTTFSTCRLDAVMEAAPVLKRLVAMVRRFWPSFLCFKTAMTGLPTTVEQEKLTILPTADRAEVLRLCDEVLSRFAARERASVTLIGDLFAADVFWADALIQFGYRRGGSLPSYFLEREENSFEEFLEAMRSSYRSQIKNDVKQLDPRHVRIEVLDESAPAAEPITEEFYAFYLRLLDRVDFHLLTLPREFFNEFIRRFSDRLQVLLAYVDDRPAGFYISIEAGSAYQLLLVGVDEELSHRYGIYRNLNYRQIGHGLSRGFRKISLGTTADEFKLRVGAVPHERVIYVKARGLLAWPFRLLAGLLIPRIPPPPPRNVFRETANPRQTRIRRPNRPNADASAA